MGHLPQRIAVLARDLGVVPVRLVVEERTWRHLVPRKGYTQGGKYIEASCDKLDSRSVSARCHR